ncbi:MAG: DUF6308 family protein [Gaiellaceae bacterium]
MTSASLAPLILRNGARIENVLESALEFIERDSSYRSYDLAAVAQDDVLIEADIRVANAMIARMSPRVIAGIHARAPIVNAALTQIPTSASLVAPADEIPWSQLENLMRAMQGIPEVKLARQTKVLHKKRPALIPILDSVLEKYLRQVDGMRRTGDEAQYAVELIRSYKRELDAALPALQALRGELQRRGIDLTECRLLDLFLWGDSGTYAPLYSRPAEGAGMTAPVEAVPAVPPVDEKVGAGEDRAPPSGALNVGDLTVAELLALSRGSLRELRLRGVIRSGNAPAGDYAELLVQRATEGELATASQKSWDVLTPSDERLQVKARVITNERKNGERQLSSFRSWDFDAAIIVLFDDEFRVWRAARIPASVLREVAYYAQHVRGHTVYATDELLNRPDAEDWTERLREVER